MRNLFDLMGGKNESQDYINVVLFAGGGGADEGMERAGLQVHVAINHDPEAIAMHKVNFPNCEHHINDVWSVSPIWATKGRKVNVLWASPDCTHHSKAKGGKPRSQKIRDLAWVVTKWAQETRPLQIYLENVEEFMQWCDLVQDKNKDGSDRFDKDGKPYMIPDKTKIDKNGLGNQFKAWRNALRKLGYKIKFKLLRACDYGAPTIRKRFFMVARRDNVKIVWPAATHGKQDSPEVQAGKLLPWRTAAECIDWDEKCPSIFERKKDLADNTLRRVAAGIRKFVQEAEKPFIVNLTHGGRLEDIDDPIKTITGANRGEKAFCASHLSSPFVVKSNHTASYYNCFRGQSLEAPLQSITKAPGFSLTTPFLTKFRQNSIGLRPDEPVHTVVAGATAFGLTSPQLSPALPAKNSKTMAACVLKNYTGVVGQACDAPLGTITAKDHHSPVTALLTRFHGRSVGSSADSPAPSVMGKSHDGLVAACFVPRYGERPGQAPRCRSVDKPAATVVSTGNGDNLVSACLVRDFGMSKAADIAAPAPTVMPDGLGKTRMTTAYITKMRGTNTASPAGDPLHTVSAKGLHHALTVAHTVKYYGTNIGQDLHEPTHTITSKGRHALSSANLIQYNGCSVAHSMGEPMNTITRKERFGIVESSTEGGHFEEAKALLCQYRRKNAWGFQVDEFDELVLDAFEGEVIIKGEVYRIEDIGLRMLIPRELFRAQGFGDDFIIDPEYGGKPLTKTAQVRMCGNSVPPNFAEALIHANRAYDAVPLPIAA